ncbi:MAG: MlaE family ABC transporter permease, partial [Planctomycetota bacterium]
GPVLVGIMLAGRIGAKIAAELGSMKVTNQIDAMSVLSLDPYKYLVLPRICALTIMAPFLTSIASFIGIVGAFLLSVYIFQVDKFFYLQNIESWIDNYSIFYGIIKSIFFGFAVGVVSCYKGIKTEGGAEDVGKSTTEAVVSSSILILFLDFLLDLIL